MIFRFWAAFPDHTTKPALFKLLNTTENAGITLTDSMAMLPASSVSGYYFSHPKSQYFGIGKIGEDQLEGYAKRRGLDIAYVKRWLASNIVQEVFWRANKVSCGISVIFHATGKASAS